MTLDTNVPPADETRGTKKERDVFQDDGTANVPLPGYAVIVETPTGKYRRRLYLHLGSAERAAERARTRGHFASIRLVRIVPAGEVHQ